MLAGCFDDSSGDERSPVNAFYRLCKADLETHSTAN
jgi:hypothetical protein